MTDAHNHLQQLAEPVKALSLAKENGVTRMLVNGTSEADWKQVEQLAQAHSEVIPSYGLHPWHVPERTSDWLKTLRRFLEKESTAALGECGLDRWKKPFDLAEQIDCLQAQLDLANELHRPLTIHCLQAWGPLLETLQRQPSLPPFLLHAYSGSTELVAKFTQLGAYFSFNGYFLHNRKTAVRDTFQQIPLDRLLLETDAPAMRPPIEFQTCPLPNEQNHPGNLTGFLTPLAKLLGIDTKELSNQIQNNFDNFYQTTATE